MWGYFWNTCCATHCNNHVQCEQCGSRVDHVTEGTHTAPTHRGSLARLSSYPLVKNSIAFAARIGVRMSPSLVGSSPMHSRMVLNAFCIFCSLSSVSGPFCKDGEVQNTSSTSLSWSSIEYLGLLSSSGLWEMGLGVVSSTGDCAIAFFLNGTDLGNAWTHLCTHPCGERVMIGKSPLRSEREDGGLFLLFLVPRHLRHHGGVQQCCECTCWQVSVLRFLLFTLCSIHRSTVSSSCPAPGPSP